MKIFCKVFLCSLYLVTAVFSQDKSVERDINQLFKRVNLLDAQKDHMAVVRTLLEILEIDSSDIRAKNQLLSALKSYANEVIEDEELLYSALYYLGNDIRIPVASIIVHFYKTNNIDKVRQFILNLYRGNESHFRIPLQDLFEMNPTNNPKLYKEILVLIKPFIYEDEQSEYLFLNLLVEPNNSYIAVLNELDLKSDNLDLCSNPSEFPRIMDLYYKKNPNPSSATINALKSNLSDCLNFNNPASRAIYFYKNRAWSELNNLMSKLLIGPTRLNISYRDLLDIDINENPSEANKLLKIFVKHLPNEIESSSFNDVEIFNLASMFRFIDREDIALKIMRNINLDDYNLITLYNKHLFQQFDMLLVKPASTIPDFKMSYYELENFDILIDTMRSRRLFAFLLNDMKNKNFVNYENKYLYLFAKVCHKIKMRTDDIFLELVNRITPNDNSFENRMIWSVSCFMTGDQNRAERIIDPIESLGSNSDIANLKIELNWWKSNGIKSNFIDMHLEKLNLMSGKEEKQYFITKSNDQNQLSSVTAENFFALLIGVESYQDKTMNLRFPLKDLNRLKDLLISDYMFVEKNVITLANPDREKLFESFEKIKKEIGLNDNLLIFYAGHGYWDKSMEQGYWIPSDATRNDRSNWISNSEIVSNLKGIKAKHTLLVADACFSGSIFATRKVSNNYDKSLEVAYTKISKKGMTSGANSPVPDKSVFVDFFLKRLKENESKYLPAETLYLEFRDAVTNNSLIDQRPLYEELDGDEGGEFIFIRK